MASIFSKIIAGEIPSYKIAEDDKFYAFLDIRPLYRGHTLVVPKEEIDYYFDLDNDLLAESIKFCKKVAAAQKEVIECNRIGVTVMGLEVPHAHIHLIPINSMKDMSFEQEPLQLSAEEMADIASRIKRAYDSN
jgi:histidine triad (HIT) family protein